MARVLLLVSPHLHGADVEHLQAELRSNAFHTDYLHGAETDGDFGPLTAQGCYRAQYWIGYAVPNQTAGTPLRRFLRGEVPITAAMAARRKARIAAIPPVPMRAKALAEAKRHVGLRETPVNLQPFGKWYGFNGVAWCAEFVSYCYAKAGSKSIAKRSRWAYCPYMVADAKAGAHGLTVVKHPKPGDIALFGPNAKGIAYHVELFDHWIDEGRTFASVGGNTSPISSAAGGMVYHYGAEGTKPRDASLIQVFAHLAL